jgi:hypothetical protein
VFFKEWVLFNEFCLEGLCDGRFHVRTGVDVILGEFLEHCKCVLVYRLGRVKRWEEFTEQADTEDKESAVNADS